MSQRQKASRDLSCAGAAGSLVLARGVVCLFDRPRRPHAPRWRRRPEHTGGEGGMGSAYREGGGYSAHRERSASAVATVQPSTAPPEHPPPPCAFARLTPASPFARPAPPLAQLHAPIYERSVRSYLRSLVAAPWPRPPDPGVILPPPPLAGGEGERPEAHTVRAVRRRGAEQRTVLNPVSAVLRRAAAEAAGAATGSQGLGATPAGAGRVSPHVWAEELDAPVSLVGRFHFSTARGLAAHGRAVRNRAPVAGGSGGDCAVSGELAGEPERACGGGCRRGFLPVADSFVCGSIRDWQ